MKLIVDQLKTRLDKYLAENLREISRGHIQRDIEAGLVKVNGKVHMVTKFVVRQGDEIEYEPSVEDKGLTPKNIPLKTLYNNHGLLIIDKPAGLPVHPGAGFKGDNLAQALLYHFHDIHLVGEEGRGGIVHRLDKDTSGVMMIALTQDMYEHLREAFESRRVKKQYIALVMGKVEKKHGFFEQTLGKSKKDFRKYTTDEEDMVSIKPSKTEYDVLEELTDGVDFYTLVVVKLHTGRTHQIRVHFSSNGNPLVGDELYGGKKAMKIGLTRQFLHSARIEVQLPNEEWIEATSKLPNDLKQILLQLNSQKVNLL